MADKPKPLADANLLQILVASGLLGGGQTQEHIEYSPRTQVGVQIMQAIVLVLSVPVILGGLWLVGGGVQWLVSLASNALDLVLLAVGVLAVGLVWLALAIWLPGRLSRPDGDRPAWSVARSLGTAVAALSGTLLTLLIVRLLAADDVNLWDGVKPALGLGMILGGVMLFWRFSNELWNPLFPKNPTTEILSKLADALVGQQQPDVVELRRAIPWRANGQAAVPVTVDGESAGQVAVQPVPAPVDPVAIDPDFLDLVAWVERAAELGLSREVHLTTPRLAMPSGRRLTRGLFEDLRKMAADEWGIIRLSGERGVPDEWVADPHTAARLLRQAMRSLAASSPAGDDGAREA